MSVTTEHHRPAAGLPPSVQRLGTPERVLHGVFLLSFIFLVVSGFLLLLPDETVMRLRAFGVGVASLRQALHRAAGAVMVGCGLVHIVHVVATRRGHRFFADIVPRPHDLFDLLHNVLWMLGRRAEAPRFHRFSYKQKAEYGALIAGSAIVGLTGIILWTSPQWSKFAVDLSKLVHGLEATLAACAIVVWHFYEVHFRPGNFLSNRTWIDGQMDTEEFAHDHGLEYDRVFGEHPDPVSVKEAMTSHRRAPRLMVTVLNAVMLVLMAGVVAGGVWLAKIQYFPSPGAGLPRPPGSGGTTGILPQQRFHHRMSEGPPPTLPGATACLSCHGYLSHWRGADDAQRSMLNMHERFLDCVVCHAPAASADGQPRSFRWLDEHDRSALPGPPEDRRLDGTSGAKIFAVTVSEQGPAVVDPIVPSDALVQLREQGDKLPEDTRRAALQEVHRVVSRPAVACGRCHGAEPHLDLAALGYPSSRVQALTGSRIWPMINGGEFYLPDFLSPRRPVRTEEPAAGTGQPPAGTGPPAGAEAPR